MAILDETQQGSFRGVRFALINSGIDGGRKDVKKLFPGSDLQLIEDLGLLPKSYNLEILISADADGEGYLENRDQFIAALESGEPGSLVHPLYGNIENIVARKYSLTESFTALGEARFKVLFELTNTNGAPAPTSGTVTDIQQSIQSSSESVYSDFIDSYINPNGSSNFNDSRDKIQSISDTFEAATPAFQNTTNAIDGFSSELATLSSNVIEFVSAPQDLIDSVGSLFIGISNLYSTPEDAFRVLEGMFSFGGNDISFDTNTVSRAERSKNRTSLNSLMNCGSLLQAYSQAIQIQFTTVEEIQAVQDSLDKQYQQILLDNTGNTNSILFQTNAITPETLNELSIIRADASKFLDNEKINTSRIITISTSETSSRLLAYQYYGSSENSEAIDDLNETSDITFLNGNVEILTA